jgi:imidazolonepropionase-like amidohydrolase
MKTNNAFRVALIFVLAGAVWAQSTPPKDTPKAEEGRFYLHKFAQRIGEETYKITPGDQQMQLVADFKFTDRGREVPLTATLTMEPDMTPTSFHIKGMVSRFSPVEDSIEGRKADNTVIGPAESFFDVEAYAPVSVQMEMVRYWRRHGSPANLMTLPHGTVQIRDEGGEQFVIGGKKTSLQRVSVRGVIWGMESLWFDRNDNLVALVGCDGEMDHFEAIASDYEDGLNEFISSAGRNNMATLGKLAASLAGTADDQVIAITGGRLVDGTGKPPVENSVVILRQGKVVAAGPAASVTVPKNAQVIHAEGKSVLPGLWDMHAHFEQVEWGPIYLATGVTTVRDVGNEEDFIVSVRDAVASGRGLGPRILMAGVVDGSGPISLGMNRVDTPEQAREQVRQYKQHGALQIKVYSSVKPEILKVVTEEAHRLGMTVTGHVPNGMTALEGIDDGMDQINHVAYVTSMMADPKTNAVTPDSAQAKAVLDAFARHHTVVDPTLALMELVMHSRANEITTFEPGFNKVAPEIRELLGEMGSPPEKAAAAQDRFNSLLETVRILHQAGVPIVVGTDQAVPGYSVDREMELYVKAGFTPMEAIQAATVVPAKVMGLEKDSGTIEPGKRADVIIVDGNPVENISDIRKVSAVFSAGKMFEPGPLWSAAGFKP